MVLRLLTHKVFIEVSLSGPTGFAIFGCSTAVRPPLFRLQHPLSLFCTQKCNNKQEPTAVAATTKGATSWQPFGSAVFILHSLCAFPSYSPLLTYSATSSSSCPKPLHQVVVGFLFCAALSSVECFPLVCMLSAPSAASPEQSCQLG